MTSATVLITNYNYGRFLGDAIRSALVLLRCPTLPASMKWRQLARMMLRRW